MCVIASSICIEILKYWWLPKEVIISPEDSVSMMKLQSTGYWRTINTRPVTPTYKAVTLAYDGIEKCFL